MTVRESFKAWWDVSFSHQEPNRHDLDDRTLYYNYADKAVGNMEMAQFDISSALEIVRFSKQCFLCMDSIKRINRTMRALCDYNCGTGVLECNPYRMHSNRIKQYLLESSYCTSEDREKILSCLPYLKHPNLYGFVIYTGCSRAEVCGLDHSSVFLAERVCYTDHLLKCADGKQEPEFMRKTRGTPRIILNTNAVEYLRREMTMQDISRRRAGKHWNNRYNLVFTDCFGQPIQREQIKEDNRLLSKLTGIPCLNLKKLRLLHDDMLEPGGDFR